jgi:hypothetical protein
MEFTLCLPVMRHVYNSLILLLMQFAVHLKEVTLIVSNKSNLNLKMEAGFESYLEKRPPGS